MGALCAGLARTMIEAPLRLRILKFEYADRNSVYCDTHAISTSLR